MLKEIPEVNYEISNVESPHCGVKGQNIISLGVPYFAAKNFSSDDMINYMSDVITHEFLHHVFDYLFKQEAVTFLFDAIGDKLRLYPELNIKMCKLNEHGARPWSIAIEQEGIEVLLNRYCFLDRVEVKKLLEHGC